MRVFCLLVSSALLANLCLPAPALAQAADAFSSSDPATTPDEKKQWEAKHSAELRSEKSREAYLRNCAGRLHKLWVGAGRPALPSVLVRFDKDKYMSCVGGGYYGAAEVTPAQKEQAKNIVAAALDGLQMPDSTTFNAVFQFTSFVLLPNHATPSLAPTPLYKQPPPASVPPSQIRSLIPTQISSQQRAAILNNDGVKAMNSNDFPTAITKFSQALTILPGYEYARDNLAIAYNNCALKMPPAQAIKYFHKALALSKYNRTTIENLNCVLQSMHKDPSNPNDRLSVARDCFTSADLDGAEVEFDQSRQLKPSAAAFIGMGDVAHARGKTADAVSYYQEAIACKGSTEAEIGQANLKLGKLYQVNGDFGKAFSSYGQALQHKSDLPSMARAINDGVQEGLAESDKTKRAQPTASAKLMTPAAQCDVDFGPYMACLQRTIKKHWFPPKGQESKRAVVLFKIHNGGAVSDVRMDHDSGFKSVNEAALAAVRDAQPFKPLPNGSPESVDIQFTFDYNVFIRTKDAIYLINMDTPDKITSGLYKGLHAEFAESWTRDICPWQTD